jgi:lipoate-protein ligase B
VISIVQLGIVDYATGLRLQQRLVSLRKEGRVGDVLLLLQHTPVITLGRNAKAHNVLASREELARRGVEVLECDRGGDVTFHGPGQLVGYPIFDLRSLKSSSAGRKSLGVVEFVRRIEEVLIRMCGEFGITTERVAGLTGVWTSSGLRASGAGVQGSGLEATVSQTARNSGVPGESESGASLRRAGEDTRPYVDAGEDTRRPYVDTGEDTRRPYVDAGEDTLRLVQGRPSAHEDGRDARPSRQGKIAAIGVHISRGVTSHGFALNVNTDLSYFDLIVPCGIRSRPVTSMERELGLELDLSAVEQSVARSFAGVFENETRWIESLDSLLENAVGVPMKRPEEFRKLHGEEESFWA